MTAGGGGTVRVYLPCTLASLRSVAGEGGGELLASGRTEAHAVTSALRDWYVDADPHDLEEELEYAASSDAAEASLHLLAEDPTAPRRRVVLAVDVPSEVVSTSAAGGPSGRERSRVVLEGDVPRSALVSVHVDDEEAVADVTAAVAALQAAEAGDEDARFTVDAAEGHELLWYDASEVADLLGER